MGRLGHWDNSSTGAAFRRPIDPSQGASAMSSKREAMPQTTALIDSLREAFGAEEMNAAMKRGMADGTFWAVENGQVVGRPQCHLPRGVWIGASALVMPTKGKR